MLYTVVPEEYFLDEHQEQMQTDEKTMMYQGVLMHILVDADGKKTLLRLHSTNPNAYLRFQPGQFIM